MATSIRVGDLVQVMRGSRQRNPEKPPTRGRVIAIDRERGVATVEGHNLRVRHLKKSQRHPQGGLLKREAPVNLSNLMLVTEDGRPVRLGKARRDEGRVLAKDGGEGKSTKRPKQGKSAQRNKGE